MWARHSKDSELPLPFFRAEAAPREREAAAEVEGKAVISLAVAVNGVAGKGGGTLRDGEGSQ